MTSAETLYADAQRYFPGGVTATARVNPAIGRPFYVARGDGPYVYDLDGREYVDLCISHGASLLGHNHPRIRDAVARGRRERRIYRAQRGGCPVCGGAVSSRGQGDANRTAYWCPACQPPRQAGP